MWKQLGWNVFDVAKTFPGALVGAMAATAELGDGTEKTDGETVRLLWEASQGVAMLSPFLRKFGRSVPLPKGGPLDGDILPPGPREPAGPGLPPREGPPTLEGEYSHVSDTQPAQAFPKYLDFMDGATSLAQKHPDGMTPRTLNATLRDLGDHFLASGDHPIETAGAHDTYESFQLKLQDLRAKAEIFHGSSNGAVEPSSDHYSTQSIYGQGFYTTDNQAIAGGYAGGVKRPGYIYDVRENRPLKMFDMEAPLTQEARDLFHGGSYALAEDALENSGVTNASAAIR